MFFIRIRTMLPAPLFMLMIGGFSGIHTLHPVYFSAVFFLFAIHRLFVYLEKAKPIICFRCRILAGNRVTVFSGSDFFAPCLSFGIMVLSRENFWRVSLGIDRFLFTLLLCP